MTTSPKINLWASAEHALDSLRRADWIPHRVEGEATLLECLPSNPRRVLDLGSGAGRLLALIKAARPEAEFVAPDFFRTMLEALRNQFASDARVTVVAHDLNERLPDLGQFDTPVSSFAIHHFRTSTNASCVQRYSIF